MGGMLCIVLRKRKLNVQMISIAPKKLKPEEVRRMRREMGLSQSEMGEMIGVSRSTYERIESGKRNFPLWLWFVWAWWQRRKLEEFI